MGSEMCIRDSDYAVKLNGAFFYTDYESLQFVVRPQLAPLTYNAGAASIRGFEVEWTSVPNPNWLITGGFGYIDGKYEELGPLVLATGIDFDSELQHTPKFKVSTGVAYTLGLNDYGFVTANVNLSYQDKIYFDAVNTEALAQDGYLLANVALTWEDVDENWRVSLGVTNATDKLYRVAGFSALGGSGSYAESTYARPREWSLSIKRRFD